MLDSTQGINSNPVNVSEHNVYIGARANNDNNGQEGFFNGEIDNLRIYSSALSSGEIFYLAGGSPVDLNDDMKIDFKDYALLANQWLDEQLWPEW